MAVNNAGIQIPPSDAADETAENVDRVNAISTERSAAAFALGTSASWAEESTTAPHDERASQTTFGRRSLGTTSGRLA
jgi:hypothetical protein